MSRTKLKMTGLSWIGVSLIVFYAVLFWFLFVQPRLKFSALASRGTESLATVTSYHPIHQPHKGGGYTVHDYTIRYDGHESHKNLGAPGLAGRSISVVYLPEAPGTVVLGKRGMSATELLASDGGGKTTTGFVLIMLVIFAGTGASLFYFGLKRIPPDE